MGYLWVHWGPLHICGSGSMELEQALASAAGTTQSSGVAQGKWVRFRMYSLNPSCSTSQREASG